MYIPSKTKVAISQITHAVRDALAGIDLIKQAQAGRELTENIPVTPLVQVYFEGKDTSSGSSTDRKSFGQNPVRQSLVTVHADIYVEMRNSIGAEMALLEELVDRVDEVIEEQQGPAYFGVDGVKSFRYHVERVQFEYNKKTYTGIRFVLEFTTL